jgi:hypothetical protein
MAMDIMGTQSKAMGFGFQKRRECPACGSADSSTRFRVRFNAPPMSNFLAGYYGVDPAPLDGEYRVEECRTCSTFYQAEVGGPDLLERIYDEWVDQVEDPGEIDSYAEDIANPRLSRDGHEVMAAASYLGLPLKELKTLDFGMGFASWAIIAREFGCDSYGTDLSKGRMEKARRQGVKTVEELGRYHFINTEQVFEHLTDPMSVMEKLADALLPGGVLKVSVPSTKGVSRFCAAMKEGRNSIDAAEILPIHPLEHVNCFTRAGITRLGRQFGLEPVRPGLWHGYAFLRHAGTLDFMRPKKSVKEMIRPIYQWVAPNNLYVWLRKLESQGRSSSRN